MQFASFLKLLVTGILVKASNGNLSKALNLAKSQDFVVEMVILYDDEFGDLFQNDREAIFEYWATQFWDVNLRFRTLQSVNVSFRILKIIHPKDIIERASIFTKYRTEHIDIVLYALGGNVDRAFLHKNAFSKTVCREFITIVIGQYKSQFREDNFPVSHLATRLGASENCTNETGFVLDTPYGGLGAKRFFFTPCNDADIAVVLRHNMSSCVSAHKTSHHPDILANYSNAVPPTLDKQCQMWTKNRNALAAQDEERCVATKCYTVNNGQISNLGTLYPLDNSPCGTDKFCFRGRCLGKSYLIQNAESKMCLQSSDRFSSKDHPELVPCSVHATPLEKFRVESNGKFGNLLVTPYSTADASENSDKCLTVDLVTLDVQYSKCSLDESSKLGWDLRRISGKNFNFLLFHQATNTCFVATPDGFAKMTKVCNFGDQRMQWQFVNKPNLQYPYNFLGMPPALEKTIQDMGIISSWQLLFLGIISGIIFSIMIGYVLFRRNQGNLNLLRNLSTSMFPFVIGEREERL